jgi:hypothetical protein
MEPQTGWFSFPESTHSPRAAEQARGAKGCSADQPGSSQGQTGPRSISSSNAGAKPNAERKFEEVAAEQDMISEAKAETKIEAGTSSRRPSNQAVRFPKPDHLVSSA